MNAAAAADPSSGLTLRRLLVAALAWAAGAALFFRAPLFSGFRWMTGDLGDWRINVFLLEHWRLAFEGNAPWSWRSPPYFFPTGDTLALHDPDFAFAIPFALLRWAGLDPYLSFQITLVAFTFAGFLAFVALALRFVAASFPLALFGAFGLAFANMNFVKLGHPNYTPVSLLALLVLFYARALAAVPHSALRANLRGAAGALLYGVLAMSCFQIAWYGGLLALATALAAALVARRTLAAAIAAAGSRRVLAFAAVQALALAAALVPFAIVFGGAWAENAGRPYYIVLHYAARPLDAINVGGGNLLWGRVVMAAGRAVSPDRTDSEAALAQTPIVALVFLILLIWLWRTRAGGDLRRASILSCGLAAVVLAPFAFKIGTVSGWWLLRGLVPGATAIRTPYRIQLVLALAHWLVIVAGAGLLRRALADALATAGPALRAAVAGGVALLGALMLVEQVNLSTFTYLDRPAELARLARIAPAPPRCRAFFVTASEPARSRIAVQTDAMLVAIRERLPTLNGVSGGFPPGWELLSVHDADYAANVAAWVRRNGIADGLCELALPQGVWSPWSPP